MDEKREILHKELDLIQGCINRMANNSFFIKGWFIVLTTAFIGLYKEKKSEKIILLYLFMALFSWIADTYFLKLERLYRKKYNWVVKNRMKNLELWIYDLNPYNPHTQLLENEDTTKTGFLTVFFSVSMVYAYLLPSLIVLLIECRVIGNLMKFLCFYN